MGKTKEDVVVRIKLERKDGRYFLAVSSGTVCIYEHDFRTLNAAIEAAKYAARQEMDR